ncbi:hypothetical protein F5X68DRAFT_240311 [Plectosphaerella plurivora]|uniref:DNA (cytosine-5-)-methyltransferase n=1 Tax=Plectosphaerella plurivora TaxID=936078 RepID=A0A9P9ABL4_9PEZI|nr:hypothetical protein F5X68DRAFT_240311 [Plectosphaerella plurivora]
MPPPLEDLAQESPEEGTPPARPHQWPSVSIFEDSDDPEEAAVLAQLAESDEEDETWEPVRPKSSSATRTQPPSTLVTPKSRYQGFEPTAPETTEFRAVKNLTKNMEEDANGFELELDEFVIYMLLPGDTEKEYPDQMYPYEMKPLHHLAVQKLRPSILYADGYLSNGTDRYYVRKMPFDTVPIGNYGLESHTVGDQIWIQTSLYEKGHSPAYFKLKNPSQEYVRFHTGFLWIVELTKHVVDYLGYMETQQNTPVEFHHFKSHFGEWIHQAHGHDEGFQRWFRQYGKNDFRIAVHANRRFVYKEAHGVMDDEGVNFHAFWDEIIHYNTYKVMGSTRQDSDALIGPVPATVVTPYIYDCFSELPFVSVMEKVEPSPATEALRQELIRQQHLEMPSKLHSADEHTQAATCSLPDLKRGIKVGSVISTMRDTGESHWRRQAVETNDSDRCPKRAAVTWIYRPADTICGDMKYPWRNELFLSDHCSCGEVGMSKITEQEITGVHSVHWGGSSTTEAEFFCRQTYLHQERRWITWQEDHLHCAHNTPHEKPLPYTTGDTVLAHIDTSTEILEPCVLLTCSPTESQMQVLPRKQKFRSNCAPNELVWSDSAQIVTVKNWHIHGRCLVRLFKPEEQLSAPYDRSGVGNAFFIRSRVDPEAPNSLVPFTDEHPFPSYIRQGMDTDDHFRKLKGFDLFCGGGNFGRGLEDAGAIEMRWANDYDPRACHTYMANLDGEQKAKVHPFVGSIDDLQRRALEGKFADNVPPVGEVEFVSGGSPCPGFSRLTKDKTTPKQRKNQSLVAAFASFIDLYRPKYGILENVVEIVQAKNARAEDVFSQLICAIVGLGYQAHFFLLDAWVYGSPQSRSRVFLAFAAPGFRLPEKPIQSHIYLEADRRTKSLGWLPNGEPMVERLFMPAAFRPVTAAAALADLPEIGDGKPDVCIRFPDHRQCYGVTKKVRNQFSLIPTRPFQMNFSKAWYDAHVITEAERELFPASGMRVQKVSKGWGRVHPQKIMSTVTTAPHPADAFIGKCMHWNEPRILTVMEVRRAQGFRDHEVILGESKEQWATIGNSVAREVSIALGLSFREALLGSLVKAEENLHTESPGPKAIFQDDLRREALLRHVAKTTPDEDGFDTTQPLPGSGPQLAEDWVDDFATTRDDVPRESSSSSSSSDEMTSLAWSRYSVSMQTTAATRFTTWETVQQGMKRHSTLISEENELHTTETMAIDEADRLKRQRFGGA